MKRARSKKPTPLERAQESARVWEASSQETERAKAYIEEQLRDEKASHAKTAKLFVDMEAYAKHLEKRIVAIREQALKCRDDHGHEDEANDCGHDNFMACVEALYKELSELRATS